MVSMLLRHSCRPALIACLTVLLVGCGAPPSTVVRESKIPQSAVASSPTLKPDASRAPSGSTVELRYPRSAVSWLGVELRATEGTEAGVEITRVLSGSPAAKAALRSGDILIRLGDDVAQSPQDVSDWVRAQRPATTYPITFLRDGAPRLVRAELEGMPEFEDRMRLEFVNRKAPEIAGVTPFQGDVASLKELHGNVVVLEFWASFCGVCRFLAPRLTQWHRLYKPQGAEVVGITVDPPKTGLQVAARTGMDYTLASDPERRVTDAYLASQIPLVVIIDRKGVVRDVMVGYSEGRLRETESLIEELLLQSP